MSLSKLELMREGVLQMREFCELNRLDVPPVREMKLGGPCGTYYNRRVDRVPVLIEIRVDLAACNVEHPRYCPDLTPLGVISHELGHHWHYRKGIDVTLRAWHNSVFTRSVTGYGASKATEDVAEAFMVFVNNPSLLEHLWPDRFAFFVKQKLTPLPLVHWTKLLPEALHAEITSGAAKR